VRRTGAFPPHLFFSFRGQEVLLNEAAVSFPQFVRFPLICILPFGWDAPVKSESSPPAFLFLRPDSLPQILVRRGAFFTWTRRGFPGFSCRPGAGWIKGESTTLQTELGPAAPSQGIGLIVYPLIATGLCEEDSATPVYLSSAGGGSQEHRASATFFSFMMRAPPSRAFDFPFSGSGGKKFLFPNVVFLCLLVP